MSKALKRIDLKDVEFGVRARPGAAFVRYSPTQKILHLNPALTAKLKCRSWEQVMVGFHKSTGTVVLKKADAEEYGSVPLLKLPTGGRDKQTPTTMEHTRLLHLGGMLTSLAGSTPLSRRYRPEANGSVIYLEPVKEAQI